jgi:hypothetical protein
MPIQRLEPGVPYVKHEIATGSTGEVEPLPLRSHYPISHALKLLDLERYFWPPEPVGSRSFEGYRPLQGGVVYKSAVYLSETSSTLSRVGPRDSLTVATTDSTGTVLITVSDILFVPSVVSATTSETLEVRRHFLNTRVNDLLTEARRENFEFGSDSTLSHEIARLLRRYGADMVDALDIILRSPTFGVDVLGELVRTLGRVPDVSTRPLRRDVLLRLLRSPLIRVRHVAATGLAELDDPNTIPALTLAIDEERSERLRAHLYRVIEQLRDTQRCLAS